MIRFGRALRRQQRGDTIVEVLISTAVISLVLAVSYSIVNRSVAANQDTQEHGQAQQLVERQIEELRAMTQSGTATGFAPNDCITDTGSLGFTSGGSCSFGADGNADSGCSRYPCFMVTIGQDASTGIYTITATWANVHGQTSHVALEYGI